jgi:RimJ/RimL family protein N-acetyltransferase
MSDKAALAFQLHMLPFAGALLQCFDEHQDELEGARLRPLRVADADALCGYLRDPVVTALTSYPVVSGPMIEAMIERSRSRWATGELSKWGVALPHDDQLVGTCGFNEWSQVHRWAELAYDLAQAHWGKGLMRQAVAAILQWTFQQNQVDRSTPSSGSTTGGRSACSSAADLCVRELSGVSWATARFLYLRLAALGLGGRPILRDQGRDMNARTIKKRAEMISARMSKFRMVERKVPYLNPPCNLSPQSRTQKCYPASLRPTYCRSCASIRPTPVVLFFPRTTAV